MFNLKVMNIKFVGDRYYKNSKENRRFVEYKQSPKLNFRQLENSLKSNPVTITQKAKEQLESSNNQPSVN
jgi:hypothetical protein